MGEFVEQSLEELLGVFEQLEQCQLFRRLEVRQLIKRCRRFEYRLQKQTKCAADFVAYADYLTDALRLLKRRRRARNYFFKKDEIDWMLKRKVDSLLRRCCERFQDRLDLWQKRVAFLKWAKMLGACSRAYARALQFHAHCPALWIAAARWEFAGNQSAENARRHLQLALRSFPTNRELWLTLFTVEVNFVKRLREREAMLVKKRHQKRLEALEAHEVEMAKQEDDKEVSSTTANPESSTKDAILEFRLAEIVVDQALVSIGECNSELLLQFWRCANDCGEIAMRLEQRLYDRLWNVGKETAASVTEEAWIAKIEKHSNGVLSTMYELYDEAVDAMRTEKMFRLYRDFLEKSAETDPSAFALLRGLIEKMHDAGYARLSDYLRLVQLDGSQQRLGEILDTALKAYGDSAQLWTAYLRVALANADTMKPQALRELFNRAVDAVAPDEQLEIWQLAIDWTLATNVERVHAVFERAFAHASSTVAARLKITRMELLAEIDADDPDVYRNEYRRFVKMVPNSLEVHEAARRLELSRRDPPPSRVFLRETFENAINEFGAESARVWLDYCAFLLEEKPDDIPRVYQRAQIRLASELADEFTKQWTIMLQKRGDNGGLEAA